MKSSHTLPFQVLRSYYPAVSTLGEYLEEAAVFEGGRPGLNHETDSFAYRKLLQTCAVASRSTRPASKSMKVTPVMAPLREVCACPHRVKP